MTRSETGERFIVTEIEGYATPRHSGTKMPGISCHVLDTAFNHRLMATFRSEVFTRTPLSVETTGARREYAKEKARSLARARADELNGLASCQLQLVAV